jgi:hypothetical protein
MGNQAATLAAHKDLRGEHLELLEGQASFERANTGSGHGSWRCWVVNSAGGSYGLVQVSSRPPSGRTSTAAWRIAPPR